MRADRDDPAPERGPSGPVPPWLEEAWTRQLRFHYDHYNWLYCGEALRAPILLVGGSESRLGQWDPRRRTISIGRSHILAHAWESVLDTLRHEMAHQYVDEVLKIRGAPPHGEPFTAACRLLRCSPRAGAAAGGLRPIEQSDQERDRMLARVRELLALASSPNEHEAASAMRMAHRFLLRYNIDRQELEGPRRFETRYLGRCSGRVQEYEYTLSNILQEHFFVLVIWTDSYDPRRDVRGRVLQVSGTPENVEMASWVHSYVRSVALRLWQERKRGGRAGRGTRAQYLAGLLRGLRERLGRESRRLREERGLVWLGDPELGKYYRRLHPRTRNVSMGGARRGDSFREGVRDGREITIRRPIPEDARRRDLRLEGPG